MICTISIDSRLRANHLLEILSYNKLCHYIYAPLLSVQKNKVVLFNIIITAHQNLTEIAI